MSRLQIFPGKGENKDDRPPQFKIEERKTDREVYGHTHDTENHRSHYCFPGGTSIFLCIWGQYSFDGKKWKIGLLYLLYSRDIRCSNLNGFSFNNLKRSMNSEN